MDDRKKGITKIIKECKNIGKKTAPDFYDAGIYGLDDLKQLGAKEAFFKVWTNNPNHVCIHPVYIWAIEGAIQGRAWNDLSEAKKKEFKQYAQDLKESFK